jgi:hypothetical protein
VADRQNEMLACVMHNATFDSPSSTELAEGALLGGLGRLANNYAIGVFFFGQLMEFGGWPRIKARWTMLGLLCL